MNTWETIKQEFVYPNGVTLPSEWQSLKSIDEKSTPISTKPKNGSYFLPTPYRAWHHRVDQFSFSLYNDAGQILRGDGVPQNFWFAADTGTTYGCYNTWPHSPVLSSWVIPTLKERLAGQAANQQVDLGQVLGELPQTVELIADTGLRLLRAARALRSGNVRALAKALGLTKSQAADTYLAYKFGFKPLMADMYAATTILSEGLKEPLLRVKATVIDSDFKPIVPGPPVIRVEGRFRRGATGSYTFRVRNYLLYDANALGILNPLALAWELFPLSFVVDWVLHIGSFLQSLSVPIALAFDHGYITSWVNNSWLATDIDPQWKGTRPRIAFHNKAMSRQVIYDFPFPLPYFRANINLGKVTSLVALALQWRK